MLHELNLIAAEANGQQQPLPLGIVSTILARRKGKRYAYEKQNERFRGFIRTGGPLNDLNERCMCNAMHKTIPIMRLMRMHRPQSSDEVEGWIEHYANSKTSQDAMRSTGTVRDFGATLHQCQFRDHAWRMKHGLLLDKDLFTLDECYAFMYNLFCVAPIQGAFIEDRARQSIQAGIQKQLKSNQNILVHVENASEETDRTHAVDLEVLVFRFSNSAMLSSFNTGNFHTKVGIQVKPSSLSNRQSTIKMNQKKNRRYGYPVVYLFYHPRSRRWSNLGVCLRSILEIVGKSI